MRPARRALVLVTMVLVAGCAIPEEPTRGELPGSDPTPGEPGAQPVYGPPDEVTAVATELDTIWEIAFSPDGRILLTERPGRIRVIEPGGELAEGPWATPPADEFVEGGLMGLALAPGFPGTPHVYTCYTYREDGGELRNRIARLTEVDGRGVNETVLLEGMDGSGVHDGCRLAFGLEGHLHATMGDAGDASNAQDRDALNGKVLRITPEGTVPSTNPFGTPVLTWGHRNPQGIAFHPATGVAYITEHGPENHDEVNVLDPGDNYGWPRVRGTDDGDGRFHPSIWTSGSGGTVAPAGAAFIQAEGSPLDGAFVFGTLKAAQLHVLTLADGDHRDVTDERILMDGAFGRIRAVVWGPDDALYLGTSNNDGRGEPGPQDDRIVRIPIGVLEDAWEDQA